MTFDQAIDALKKMCENGDGAPEHSEQPPQWRVPENCDCRWCEIRRAIEDDHRYAVELERGE